MKIKIVALGLAAALVFSSADFAYASVIKDAQNKISEAEVNLKSVNKEIDNLSYQEFLTKAEIEGIDADLVQVLLDLEVIEADLETTKIKLAESEDDLVKAKEKEAQQYEDMKKRIQYIYENGESINILNSLLTSDDFADVLNKVGSSQEIHDTDRELLINYQNTKVEVNNLVEQIKEEKEQLEEMQNEYKKEQESLEELKKQKETVLQNYASQLEKAKTMASSYKAVIEKQNQIIQTEIARQKAAAAARVTAGSSIGATSSKTAVSNSSIPHMLQSSIETIKSSASGNATPASENTSVSSNTQATGTSTQSTSVSKTETPAAQTTASSNSGLGSSIASYAQQFVGNPYVWGGTSLTNGADCSGFIMSVYANYGYSLPHSSSAMASVGKAVSASDLQPGDIICYSGHVALYIGNGAIVHASSPETGIKISSNYNYRSVVAIRRVV